jgi:hypothetical protein
MEPIAAAMLVLPEGLMLLLLLRQWSRLLLVLFAACSLGAASDAKDAACSQQQAAGVGCQGCCLLPAAGSRQQQKQQLLGVGCQGCCLLPCSPAAPAACVQALDIKDACLLPAATFELPAATFELPAAGTLLLAAVQAFDIKDGRQRLMLLKELHTLLLCRNRGALL